jgi:hypothetical protein
VKPGVVDLIEKNFNEETGPSTKNVKGELSLVTFFVH